FHYEPYKLRWHPAHKKSDIRVHGELYSSQAFIEAHQKLLKSPQEAGCDLPWCIARLMFWSDSTHLTTFGSAKLWLLYPYFGNESKYIHCQPTSHLCSHVAYFQTLPDTFTDFVVENTRGKPPSDALLTHCHRELFHVQWCILLDDEFLEAYQHGIVIACCNQIKVLITTIRNLGMCPCPPKNCVHLLATETDMLDCQHMAHSDTLEQDELVSSSHKLIYKKHYTVDSVHVEALLKNESLIP
ncbi:hypothetical protein PAXINDRAFT_33838, partial [Paxillus involutus ATCC 200175]